MKPKPPIAFDTPIAWVCRTYEANGKTEVEVIREGMSRVDILANFPPHWASRGKIDFGRKDLIKAIIFEAYQEVESGAVRDRKNIRGFWYERIFHTLIRVMGEPGDAKNIASIESSINEAWAELVEGGHVTYNALNLYSEKENNYRIEVREDSPYPTAIVLVEKASLYDALNDIAHSYEISFTCAGGQNSRAAAMDYADKLERRGIDLSQNFTVFSFCDYDPEGWAIPSGFIEHLSLRVTGDIKLVRMGVLPEHLGESVIRYQAIPYSLEADNESARKAKQTKYDNFVEETGGLFIPGPGRELVPARVELNIYTDEQIRERIIEGLVEHLDGFSYQIRGFKKAIDEQYQGAWNDLVGEIRENVNDEYESHFNAISEAMQQLQVEKSKRATEERDQIAELRRQIDTLETIIVHKTRDITQKQSALKRLRESLEDEVSMVSSSLINEAQDADLPDPDELVAEIESNGGWRKWAEELDLSIIDTDEFTTAGRQRRWLDSSVKWDEKRGIREWIYEQMDVDTYPDSPDELPEEMIARALAEAAGRVS